MLLDMCGHYFDMNRVEIHAGCTTRRCLAAAGLKLAFVHIDCDFYQSTVEVLDRLFTIDALPTAAQSISTIGTATAQNRNGASRRLGRT